MTTAFKRNKYLFLLSHPSMIDMSSRRVRRARERAKAREKVDVSSVSDDIKHMIVHEWAHYTISMDELARKYGSTWEQVYEIIKNAKTQLLWTQPKERVR